MTAFTAVFLLVFNFLSQGCSHQFGKCMQFYIFYQLSLIVKVTIQNYKY